MILERAVPSHNVVAIKAALFAVGFLAVLSQRAIDAAIVAPLVAAQRTLLAWYAGSNTAVVIDPNCSGADVMAMYVAMVLAYPASWRHRLAGVALGLPALAAVNIVRVGTLGWMAGVSGVAFRALHGYLWPVLLTACAALFLRLWIGNAKARSTGARRVCWIGAATLAAYAAVSPWILTSAWMDSVCRWTAATAGAALAAAGVSAGAAGPTISIGTAAYRVEPLCLWTPALPVYLTVVLALPIRRRRRIAAAMAAVPLFLLLGIARVLTVAIPPAIAGEPLTVVHAFFQMLAGGVALAGAAALSRDVPPRFALEWRTATARRAAVAIFTAAGCALAVSALGLSFPARWDVQGAVSQMVPYQLGLFAGLAVALGAARQGHRIARDLAIACAASLACIAAAAAWIATTATAPPVLAVRAAALAVPLALSWWLFLQPRMANLTDTSVHCSNRE